MFIINNKFSVEQNSKMKPLMPMEYNGWVPRQWTESCQGEFEDQCPFYFSLYLYESGTIDLIVPSKFYQLLCLSFT